MAGHSKWANIKHKKAREDAKRGKVFSALVKKITSAAKRGGGDLETNTELRLYVDKAKAANMPAANIERAILKATGQLEGVSYEDVSYEGYGPGGVAFFVEGSTDNRNRTVSNVRHFFSKNNGNLGADGCVAWMFHTQGVLVLGADQFEDEEELMMVALEAGADDMVVEDGVATITTTYEDFITVRQALVEGGYIEFLTDEITKIAENSVSPTLSEVKANLKLIDMLEDDDDIENVYHNMDLSDDVAAALAAD